MTKTLESKISQGDPEGVEIDCFNLDEERKRKKIFVVIQNKTDQAPKNLDKSLNLEKNDKNEFKHPIQRVFYKL